MSEPFGAKRERQMNLDRPSKGEVIANVSALLLFAFTFLDWYGQKQDEAGSSLLFYLNLFVHSLNAWEALAVTPIFLMLTVAIATGASRLALLGSDWEPPIPRNAAVAALGAISSLLILYRIIFPPHLENIDGVSFHAVAEPGVFLALAAALGVALGGCLAMREEGISFFDLRALRHQKKGHAHPRERACRPGEPTGQHSDRASLDP
jgi:hypothetical protein